MAQIINLKTKRIVRDFIKAVKNDEYSLDDYDDLFKVIVKKINEGVYSKDVCSSVADAMDITINEFIQIYSENQ